MAVFSTKNDIFNRISDTMYYDFFFFCWYHIFMDKPTVRLMFVDI